MLLQCTEHSLKTHFNVSVKVIECDNEIYMMKPKVNKWLETKGITVEPSAPDTQAQNGGAERAVGVTKFKARAMRVGAHLPEKLWPEITRAAVYLHNRTPNSATGWSTPYEIFFTYSAFRNGIVKTLRKPDHSFKGI